MKDKKHNATTPSDPSFSARRTSNVPRTEPSLRSSEEAAPAVKSNFDRDKINRRYSFDDNGGGYLGL